MDYTTFNGIPLISYGLIGVTTMLLTYSVFSDDAKPEPPPPETVVQQIQSMMPTMSSPDKKEPEAISDYLPKIDSVQSLIPAAISDNLPTVSAPTEGSFIPTAISELMPGAEKKGGKRKRTKHKQHKKKTTHTKRKR